MKHILDSEFRYRPSFDTDVRKTFEKARRQQQLRRDGAGGDAKINARAQGEGAQARAAEEG